MSRAKSKSGLRSAHLLEPEKAKERQKRKEYRDKGTPDQTRRRDELARKSKMERRVLMDDVRRKAEGLSGK